MYHLRIYLEVVRDRILSILLMHKSMNVSHRSSRCMAQLAAKAPNKTLTAYSNRLYLAYYK